MMARTWEQEKAYGARRANQAIIEMERAIRDTDIDRFTAAWNVAMRYMRKKERMPYYYRMLQKLIEGGHVK